MQGERDLKHMRDFALSQLPEDHVVNLRRADTVQVSYIYYCAFVCHHS
jgi:hypothetical protein